VTKFGALLLSAEPAARWLIGFGYAATTGAVISRHGAAVLGALIMIVADWLGRNLLLPYQIPAGLLTILVGAPYFIRLMSRQ
jgi:ABC-type Fe3+-siderophore transport system permease subunit